MLIFRETNFSPCRHKVVNCISMLKCRFTQNSFPVQRTITFLLASMSALWIWCTREWDALNHYTCLIQLNCIFFLCCSAMVLKSHRKSRIWSYIALSFSTFQGQWKNWVVVLTGHRKKITSVMMRSNNRMCFTLAAGRNQRKRFAAKSMNGTEY